MKRLRSKSKCSTNSIRPHKEIEESDDDIRGKDISTASSSASFESESYFSRLPAEMVCEILGYVVETSRNSTLQARQVCQSWNKIIRPQLSFQGALTDNTIQSLAELDKAAPLKYLFLNKLNRSTIVRGNYKTGGHPIVKNRRGGKDYQAACFQRSVEHLVIGGDVGCFLKKHGSDELPFSLSTGFAENHEHLPEVKDSISGSDLLNILPQIRDVKVLTLSSIAFSSVSPCMLRKINFSAIFSTVTKLDICIGRHSRPQKIMYFFEKTTFPNLLSLYIRVYSACYNLRLFIAYYMFIAKHPKLKYLSLSQSQAAYSITKSDLRCPTLMLRNYSTLVDMLLKIKLECLRIDCVIIGHPIASDWKLLERAFIKNQSQLRSLELQVSLRLMDQSLHGLLPSCSQTLERLELSTHNMAPNAFDCVALSEFKKLQQCHLYMRNPDVPFQVGRETGIPRIDRIDKLPESITSLHLANLLSFDQIKSLQGRLVNLKRISYGGNLVQTSLQPNNFILYVLEHLKFQSLVEFRLYRYSCSVCVTALNSQDGLMAFVEDGDSVVVYVDREDFNLESAYKNLRVPRCKYF